MTDSENDFTWDGLGEEAHPDMQWFKKDDLRLINENYLYELKSLRKSYQSCAAIAPLYSTKNGEAVDEDMNKKYWMAKEGVPVTIHTGFRIWEDRTEDEYEDAGDADPIQYSLYDFGLEKPPEPIRIDIFTFDGA